MKSNLKSIKGERIFVAARRLCAKVNKTGLRASMVFNDVPIYADKGESPEEVVERWALDEMAYRMGEKRDPSNFSDATQGF